MLAVDLKTPNLPAVKSRSTDSFWCS